MREIDGLRYTAACIVRHPSVTESEWGEDEGDARRPRASLEAATLCSVLGRRAQACDRGRAGDKRTDAKGQPWPLIELSSPKLPSHQKA